MFDIEKQTVEEYRANRVVFNGKLYDAICDILFRYDPVGIGYFDNIDEYEPEADTIVPRLSMDVSVGDIEKIVNEEFMKWFNDGKPSSNYGSKETFHKIALEIWNLRASFDKI